MLNHEHEDTMKFWNIKIHIKLFRLSGVTKYELPGCLALDGKGLV